MGEQAVAGGDLRLLLGRCRKKRRLASTSTSPFHLNPRRNSSKWTGRISLGVRSERFSSRGSARSPQQVVRYMCACGKPNRQNCSTSWSSITTPSIRTTKPSISPRSRPPDGGSNSKPERLRSSISSKVQTISKSIRPPCKKFSSEEAVAGFSAEVDLSEYDFHLLYYRGAIKEKINSELAKHFGC